MFNFLINTQLGSVLLYSLLGILSVVLVAIIIYKKIKGKKISIVYIILTVLIIFIFLFLTMLVIGMGNPPNITGTPSPPPN